MKARYCLALLTLAGLACTRERAGTSASAPSASATLRQQLAAKVATATRLDSSMKPERGTHREADEPTEAPGPGKDGWIVDHLVDVAPAGPAAATPEGVVLRTRDDELALAPLSPQRGGGSRPQPTPVKSLELEASSLEALARGPSISGKYAYFVSHRRLVRRPLAGGPLERLTSDARDYTRVSALPAAVGEPAAAGYISEQQGQLVAKLWVEGRGAIVLTPDGSSSMSVSLARQGKAFLAVSLEGRTGMSPLHATRVEVSAGSFKATHDVVAWVGGTSSPYSEVVAIAHHELVSAMLAVERDASHFGLARIALDPIPKLESDCSWRNYPNGMEPAPVATAEFCGQPVVAYVRPSTDQPHAPQELHLAPITSEGLGPSQVIARGKAFNDVSLARLDGGALVVYVADRRTWARRLRCAH